MAKEIKLTQESLDAYKDELEYLKTTRADEVAEQLKEARSSATCPRTPSTMKPRMSRASCIPALLSLRRSSSTQSL